MSERDPHYGEPADQDPHYGEGGDAHEDTEAQARIGQPEREIRGTDEVKGEPGEGYSPGLGGAPAGG